MPPVIWRWVILGPLSIFVLFIALRYRHVSAPAVGIPTTPGERHEGVMGMLDAAQRTLDIEADSITSDKAVHALVGASNRGVGVRIIINAPATEDDRNAAAQLLSHGVGVWTSVRPSVARNKTVIIDDETVMTGHFNFPDQHGTEPEDIDIALQNKARSMKYSREFLDNLEQSVRYGQSAATRAVD